jgi:hypothetical protein
MRTWAHERDGVSLTLCGFMHNRQRCPLCSSRRRSSLRMGGGQLFCHLIRRAIAREEQVPDLQPPGVRESAENGRTTRIMSSLGRTAAPSTRFLAWQARAVLVGPQECSGA